MAARAGEGDQRVDRGVRQRPGRRRRPQEARPRAEGGDRDPGLTATDRGRDRQEREVDGRAGAHLDVGAAEVGRRRRQVDAGDDLVASALDAIRCCALPTVAAIRGACIGGGLEIAGCCDIRIAGESARFGAPINRLGFSMYPGEMAGLLALVGPAVVLEILLEGRILTAHEALHKGLLSRVVGDASVFDEAAACAARICAGAPLVARWHKQWVRRLMNGAPLSEAEKREAFDFLATADYREGLDAFLNKRTPRFTGR